MVTFSGVHNRFPMRRRVVTQSLRYNPNFAFLMASGIMADTPDGLLQRNRVIKDIKDIYTATGGELLLDLATNISWDDSEDTIAAPGIGNYDWARFELLRGMADKINTDLNILNPADGCQFWGKLFIRNYDSDNLGNSTPSVPRYMRSSASNRDYVGLAADGGGYGGTGVNANGEYEGKLGAGSAAGATTRQAKIWVPAVANRFKEWLIAIGNKYNPIPNFAGIIINETSLLNAIPGASGMTPDPPTDDSTVVYTYFQRYFQAIIDARQSFDQCEVMISANSPIAPSGGMYAMTPLKPSVLYTQHKIGQFMQDGYKADTPTPKNSTQVICQETQPHSIDSCSYAVNLSGDVRRHKAVLGSTFNSTSTVTAGTGTKTFTVPSMSVTNGAAITIMANINEPNQVLMTGTIASATCPLPGPSTCTTTTLVCTITSSSGSGSRSSWKLSLDANYLPPHSLEELVSYAVTAQPSGQGSWGTHSYKGCTHLFFNITSASTGSNEGQRNYVEYVEYLKTTAHRVKTERPHLY